MARIEFAISMEGKIFQLVSIQFLWIIDCNNEDVHNEDDNEDDHPSTAATISPQCYNSIPRENGKPYGSDVFRGCRNITIWKTYAKKEDLNFDW